MGVQRRQSSSMRMSEIITHTCEAAWGSAGAVANVTTTADATVYKIGAKSAKHAIAFPFTTGIVAWSTTGAATVNFATAGYTHVKMWIRSSVALAAGVLTFGLDNAVDFSTAEGAGHRSVAIPAIPVVDTWYRVIIPLTDDQKALTSVDSFGITAASDPGVVNVYFDDIRFCKYDLSGNRDMSLPSTCTLNNTNADGINTDVWQFPFMTDFTTVHTLPQDAKITYYQGYASAFTTSDVECCTDYLFSGESYGDLVRECTSVAIVLGADLVWNDTESLREHVSIAGVA